MAEPVVVSVTREYRQELVQREAGAVDAMVLRWLEVEAALEADISRLVQQLAERQAAGESITEAQLFRLERMQSLLAQTQRQMSRFMIEASTRIEGLQAGAVEQGLENATSLMSASLEHFDNNPAVALTFNRLNIEATENITALARAGQPLAKLLETAYPQAAQGMITQMINGVALGVNPREVTRRIMREGLAQGLNHVLLVTRDQHLRAYKMANLAQMKNSRVVSGYRRLAAKQTRTCLACLALDGKFYSLDDPFIQHTQCRCALLPVVMGLNPIEIESGEAWFNRQPPEAQKEMMGPGRYEAWRKGLFEFKDQVAIVENLTWGPGTRLKSLKELGV